MLCAPNAMRGDSRFRRRGSADWPKRCRVLVYAKRADGSGYANQQHLDYIGKTQDELAAASWIDHLHPDDIARVRAERAVSIRDLAAMQTEFRGRAADGSYRWLLGRFAPLRETDGSVTWIGAAMDIDDRRRADAELRLLAQAMACVRDYIMILEVDPLSPADNTIIFANQAVIDRTGYTRDELIALPYNLPYNMLLGDGGDVPAMLTRLRAAMLEHRQIRIEMAQVARDKSIFWIDADVIPMFDAFDNFTHVVAVGRDITARKAADEEVFHSTPSLN